MIPSHAAPQARGGGSHLYQVLVEGAAELKHSLGFLLTLLYLGVRPLTPIIFMVRQRRLSQRLREALLPDFGQGVLELGPES